MAETHKNIYKPRKHLISGMGEIQSIKILDETYKPNELEKLAHEIAKKYNIELVETEEGLYPIGGIYYRELIGENQEISLNYNMTASLALEPGAKLPVDAKETITELIKKQEFEEMLIIEKDSEALTIMKAPYHDSKDYSVIQNVSSHLGKYTLLEIKTLFL